MKRVALLSFISLTLQMIVGVPHAHAAGRACVENFSESNQNNQRFQSFINVNGDSNKALVALARSISGNGFLGLTVNKDIGVISAYQEDNGKKSPISGSVIELSPGKLRVETSLSLATGLRATKAAVLEAMCRLLESTMSEDERTNLASDASHSVLLKGAGVEQKLGIKVGTFRHAGAFFVILLYMDFSGNVAAERTKERKPVLSVPTKEDPSKFHYLVKLTSDSASAGARSMKIGSAGSLISMAVTGKTGDILVPDADWTRPFEAKLEGEGRWTLIPTQPLEPGEYGLWDSQNGGLSEFGVD